MRPFFIKIIVIYQRQDSIFLISQEKKVSIFSQLDFPCYYHYFSIIPEYYNLFYEVVKALELGLPDVFLVCSKERKNFMLLCTPIVPEGSQETKISKSSFIVNNNEPLNASKINSKNWMSLEGLNISAKINGEPDK